MQRAREGFGCPHTRVVRAIRWTTISPIISRQWYGVADSLALQTRIAKGNMLLSIVIGATVAVLTYKLAR